MIRHRSGSLVVVGTGIRAASQATLEAVAQIQCADKLMYVAADPVTEHWLRELNPSAESLASSYAIGQPRAETYEDMVVRILDAVRAGQSVCVAMYGHPGVAAWSGHAAVRRAREEGYAAEMLPGVSCADALFADLGVDPAADGCQSYEATSFLLSRRRIDPYAGLILWQIGLIGQSDYRLEFGTGAVPVLVEVLAATYGSSHPVIVYEAALSAVASPTIEKMALGDLPSAPIRFASTLYVPPLERAPADEAMARRLRAALEDSAVSETAAGRTMPTGWMDDLVRDGWCHFRIDGAPASDDELRALARRLLPLAPGASLGKLRRVQRTEGTTYTTLTRESLSFHNDGLYRAHPPRFILLHCDDPGTAGGETLIVDGHTAWETLPAATRSHLETTTIDVRVESRSASRRFAGTAPGNGQRVLHFFDPGDRVDYSLEVAGSPLNGELVDGIRASLTRLPSACVHWQAGDVVILDNLRVLHARRAFRGDRVLRRIVIGQDAALED